MTRLWPTGARSLTYCCNARSLDSVPTRSDSKGEPSRDLYSTAKASRRFERDGLDGYRIHFRLTQGTMLMNKSLLLASLVAAVALAACGKKEEVPAAPPATSPAPAPAPVSDAASAAASAAVSAGTAAASAAAGAASATADAAKEAAGKAVEAAKDAASKASDAVKK